MNETLHDDCDELGRALTRLAQRGDWSAPYTLSVVGCWLSYFFEEAPDGEALLDRFVATLTMDRRDRPVAEPRQIQ
jgi:hypothetical protein